MTARALSSEQVVAAREAYRAGETITEIAARLGIHHGVAHRMLRGVTYSDVPGWLRRGEIEAIRKARQGEPA